MIKPTIGRKVWYVPLSYERAFDHRQSFDASITHVWSDNMVNLCVKREDGSLLVNKTSVILAQDRRAQPGECEWMDYQKSVAPYGPESAPKERGVVADPATP